jgi:hypothetical protein
MATYSGPSTLIDFIIIIAGSVYRCGLKVDVSVRNGTKQNGNVQGNGAAILDCVEKSSTRTKNI